MATQTFKSPSRSLLSNLATFSKKQSCISTTKCLQTLSK